MDNTPKEKAKQLYYKMKFQTEYNSQPSTVHGMCKKLALICVRQTIDALREYKINPQDLNYKWWIQVRKELENL